MTLREFAKGVVQIVREVLDMNGSHAILLLLRYT